MSPCTHGPFYYGLRVLTRDGLFNPFEVPRQIQQKLINHGEEKDRIVFATFAFLEKDHQFSPAE
jgi:hypothetical protein